MVAGTAFGLLIAPGCSVTTSADDAVGGSSSEGGKSSGGATHGEAGSSNEGGNAPVTSSGGAAGNGTGGAAGAPEATAGAANAGGGAGGESSGRTCEAPSDEWKSAKGTSCASYCTEFFRSCQAYLSEPGVVSYDDEAQCEATCNFFDQSQLCCRAYHASRGASATGECALANGDAWPDGAGGAGGADGSGATPCN